jgi:hypothetical protein
MLQFRPIWRSSQGLIDVHIPGTAVASAALLAAVGIGIATAGPAAASGSRALTYSSGGGVAIAGTRSGADTDCSDTSTGSGTGGAGGSSWAEWTANSCGYSLQERTWCVSQAGVGSWSTSGVVVKVGLLDSSFCTDAAIAERGEKRISENGGSSWSPYMSFWTPGGH